MFQTTKEGNFLDEKGKALKSRFIGKEKVSAL